MDGMQVLPQHGKYVFVYLAIMERTMEMDSNTFEKIRSQIQ